jgi:CheY-like chemotaxis protein
MTNEAILGILDNLCNDARNSMHAVFGLLEPPGDSLTDCRWQSCVETGRASADRLLRAIDDARELLAGPPAAPQAGGGFDLSVCLREAVELLNLANPDRGRPISLGARALPVRQDRHAVEQVLIRILTAARELAGAGGVRVEGAVLPDGLRFTIDVSDAAAAERLAGWLNADPDRVSFPDPAEVPLTVAVMVAGKRIRAMGGTAEVAGVESAHEGLVVNLPMAAAIAGGPGAAPPQRGIRPESLNVLMAEDCDDSYALSELLLRSENLWRARNGREAFELVRKQRFDVVFMDVHMPGIDGYEAVRAIRDWETETGNARTPVVVLSSDDLETQRRFAAQSGCSGFLRKPLRNGELLDALKRLRAARSPAA